MLFFKDKLKSCGTRINVSNDFFATGLNVTVSKPSYVGEIGSSITLGCIISSKSSDVSEVRWYFHSNSGYHPLEPTRNRGKYSIPTPENPSLTIEKLDLNDVGPYMCSATIENRLTVNSTTTHLSLLDSKGIHFNCVIFLQ